MGIKLTPLFEQVPLDDLGYKSGWVEIRTNPTGAETRAFAAAWTALIEEDATWKLRTAEYLRALSDVDKDDSEQRAQLAAKYENASKIRDRKRAGLDRVFLTALAHLLGECQIGSEKYALNTVEGLEAFEEQGDPQIVWFGRSAFMARREERVTVAVDSFRGQLGRRAEPARQQSGQAAVALTHGGRANNQSIEPVPGN